MPNTKQNKTTKQKQTDSKTLSLWVQIISIISACILTLIAQTAFWLNRNIFNTQKFTQKATYAITSEDSRQSLGNEISDRILSDRPLIKRVAGPKLSGLISSLLGTNLAEKALYDVVQQTNIYVTSPNQKSIGLDLQGIKSGINSLSQIADIFGKDPGFDQSRVPDKLVLINADSIPSFYKEALVVLWMGPLSLILAALIFMGLLYWGQADRLRTGSLICLSIIVTGFVGLSSGPLIRPVIQGLITSPNIRSVYQNVYNEMLTPFNHQMITMIILTALILVALLAKNIYLKLARKIKK